jgi:hypothetical protein
VGEKILYMHSKFWWRWDDNIKRDFKEIRGVGANSNHLPQTRDVVGSCEHGNESLGSIACGEFLE